MKVFQTRRVLVRAQQWFNPNHPQHDPSMLTTYKQGETRKVGDLFLSMKGGLPGVGGGDRYALRTSTGDMKVCDGDWIVNPLRHGDKHVLDPEAFDALYEPHDPST